MYSGVLVPDCYVIVAFCDPTTVRVSARYRSKIETGDPLVTLQYESKDPESGRLLLAWPSQMNV